MTRETTDRPGLEFPPDTARILADGLLIDLTNAELRAVGTPFTDAELDRQRAAAITRHVRRGSRPAAP